MAEARQEDNVLLRTPHPSRKRVAPGDPTVLADQASMLVCPQCGSVYTRELDFCGLDGERLVESDEDPLIGRAIDRYRVVASVGAGGMARVYKAEHVYLEQHFALKVLHGEIASDRDLARRFHREAKALGRIKHENIVTVADFGATREGLLFMVMEYLDGPTLSSVLKAQRGLRPPRAATITHQLAAGLAAAHGEGYVHRDLKPGNVVLVDKQGAETAKILDFGLVRIVEREVEPTRLTQHGMFFGTPAYMAPEQITGEEAGPPADLYALGVLLYYMITGSLPFEGDVKALAHHHLHTPPPRPENAFGGLTDLALDLLAKSPADRPTSARAVAERLTGLSLLPARDPRPATPRPQLSKIDANVCLSTPVIAEERSLIEETEGEDPREISRSIREAIGIRAYLGGWVPVVVFVLFAAVISLWLLSERRVAEPRSPPSRSETPPPESSPSTAGPKATSSSRSPPAAKRQAPPKPRRQAKPVTPAKPPSGPSPPDIASTAAPTGPPPPAKPPAAPSVPELASPETPSAVVLKEPPPAADTATPLSGPPTPPTPATESRAAELATIDTIIERITPTEPIIFDKSFKELDLAIGWALFQRGLAWEDLAAAAPEAAGRWSDWSQTSEEPPVVERSDTYRALENAVENIAIDAPLLQVKLARIRHGLEAAESPKTSARVWMLRDRYRRLRRDVGRLPMPRSPLELAAELTVLESDVKVLEAEVRRRTAARPPPPLAVPQPLLDPKNQPGD